MALTVGTNAYCDSTYADSYFEDRLYADVWNNASATQKDQALVTATRAIDRQFLIGSKKTDGQVLQFPRRYPFQIHDIWKKWFQDNINDQFETLYVEAATWYADSDVPDIVKQTCCEEAMTLIDRLNGSRTKLQRQGVTETRMGRRFEEKYAPGHSRGLFSVEAQELMRPYLAGAVNII